MKDETEKETGNETESKKGFWQRGPGSAGSVIIVLCMLVIPDIMFYTFLEFPLVHYGVFNSGIAALVIMWNFILPIILGITLGEFIENYRLKHNSASNITLHSTITQ